mmetsp:Transcript_2588/g.8586  ORF Transcript_2588/g.8586 Transcript_2588/m.8586 type:complete len:239 (-) Transcript_2588:106-822(-)
MPAIEVPWRGYEGLVRSLWCNIGEEGCSILAHDVPDPRNSHIADDGCRVMTGVTDPEAVGRAQVLSIQRDAMQAGDSKGRLGRAHYIGPTVVAEPGRPSERHIPRIPVQPLAKHAGLVARILTQAARKRVVVHLGAVDVHAKLTLGQLCHGLWVDFEVVEVPARERLGTRGTTHWRVCVEAGCFHAPISQQRGRLRHWQAAAAQHVVLVVGEEDHHVGRTRRRRWAKGEGAGGQQVHG